jgi:hypothetical protein
MEEFKELIESNKISINNFMEIPREYFEAPFVRRSAVVFHDDMIEAYE